MTAKPSTKKVLGWIISFLAPYKKKVFFAGIALFLGSATWLALGQGIRLFIDSGFLSGESDTLSHLVGLMLAIVMVGCIATFFRAYLVTWLGERVSADIRLAVFNRLLSLSPHYFQEQRTGEIISRFTADATLLQTVVGMSLSMALRSSVTAFGGIIMMLFTSFKLAALALIAVPLVLAPIAIFGKKVKTLARDSQDKVADVGAHLDETLHEIHTVQSYTHEYQDRMLFGQRIASVMNAAESRIFYRSLLITVVMAFSLAAVTLVSWYGALQVVQNNISAGELTAFLFYAVMVASAVATLSAVIGDILRAVGASERMMELQFANDNLIKSQPANELSDNPNSTIEISNLCFSYPNDALSPVLQDINLTIKPGERVALVGPSGAGKSTLFQLLLRFYLPNSGYVSINSQDISQCSNESVRKQFAIVPQESVIFATSVFENVRYGRTDATLDEVKKACIAARADEFISSLSDGYETQLGERGTRLSGGQKQRIAIARAILSNRPILLLDEATSALDAVSESKVQQALDNLMQGRTSIIIAHRLATVRNVDRILLIENGTISASGSHDYLVANNETYRKLAELQLLT
ncbi:ABC transporter transmembrane domain-containing protein [Paraferrimonas haliotis]|uniref:ABC transporter permease n=1 Tax=Paraferrimonas haliotis TaxID=2013866 RepID=A0AA37TXU2_9GAMM|nr:ABC transporter transmembrane domain-containing protein [Paraferrimonas haliotis]GLS84774.1 ABC transporter permease [Paraferrimonas haliotis]